LTINVFWIRTFPTRLPWGHKNIPYGLDIEMEEDRARDEALLIVMTGLSAEEEEDVEMM